VAKKERLIKSVNCPNDEENNPCGEENNPCGHQKLDESMIEWMNE
jgi:hypothetical protein